MSKNKQLLNIIKWPNETLKTENKVVTNFDSHMGLVINMIHTMKSVNGLGLAAPQVGVNIKLFIAVIDNQPLVVFNPLVIKVSDNMIKVFESCLSCPDIEVEIGRPNSILVEYQDFKGRLVHKHFEGRNSIVMCHELDHLNGVLIVDHTPKEPENAQEAPTA